MLYAWLTICGALAAALEGDLARLARLADEQAATLESANKSVQEVNGELIEKSRGTATQRARVLKLANGSEHVYYGGGCL